MSTNQVSTPTIYNLIKIHKKTGKVTNLSGKVLFSQYFQEDSYHYFKNMKTDKNDYIMCPQYILCPVTKKGGDIQLFVTGSLKTNEPPINGIIRECGEELCFSPGKMTHVSPSISNYGNKWDWYTSQIGDMKYIGHVHDNQSNNPRYKKKVGGIFVGSYDDVQNVIKLFKPTLSANDNIDSIVFVRVDLVRTVMPLIIANNNQKIKGCVTINI